MYVMFGIFTIFIAIYILAILWKFFFAGGVLNLFNIHKIIGALRRIIATITINFNNFKGVIT